MRHNDLFLKIFITFLFIVNQIQCDGEATTKQPGFISRLINKILRRNLLTTSTTTSVPPNSTTENVDYVVIVESGSIGSKSEKEVELILNNLEEGKENATIVESSTKKSTPIVKIKSTYRKIQPNGGCRRYSEAEKYQLLEAVGGRNQAYMASSVDEAALHFPPIMGEAKEGTLADDVQRDLDVAYCGSMCEEIKTKLRNHSDVQKLTSPLNDDFSEETEDDYSIRGRPYNQGCYLNTFIPISNCSLPGEETDWGWHRLCSYCRGIYILSPNCFPSLFNAVTCNEREPGCIYDAATNRAHGRCSSSFLSLRVLRNRGSSQCEEWSAETIELPVSCQCALSSSSWLNAQPAIRT